MPEISVVMPVYNGEEYLPAAVESILNQTFKDLEFLIVCEHGTNASCMDILERYAEKDRRVRLIQNSQRLGIAASLNVGMQAATGRYIARMDGDDISGLRRFEVQKLFLDACPDIGVCGTDHTVINSPKWIVDYVADPEQNSSNLLFFAVMRHPTIMLRRPLAEKCRYDEDLPGAEDYAFYLALNRETKLSNIMDPSLFAYRRTGDNNSAVYKARDVLIRRESQRKELHDRLRLDLTNHEMDVLNYIGTGVYADLKRKQYADVLPELERLLERIERRNGELGVYRPSCMTRTLQQRWFREQKRLERITKGNLPEAAAERLRKGKYYSIMFG